MKTALIAVAIIAISAALLGGVRHPQAYADSPTGTRVTQSPDDASQALRHYTLQLLHILSDADSNQWERYRQAMPHCEAAPTHLDAIGSGSDVGPLDATLIALIDELCADLDQRLDEARTVGLLMNEPEAMSGYVLLTGGFNNDVHLIDHLGRVAHLYQGEHRISHAKLLDNGNLLIGVDADRIYHDSIVETDPEGNAVWQYYKRPDDIHHDFIKMPNGNVLMIVQGVKTMEEAIAVGVNPIIVPSNGMLYDYLIEVRPAGSDGGEIVWEWSSWDYIVQDFDSTKPNYGDPSHHPELIDINYYYYARQRRPVNGVLGWLHTNAIDYNPTLDQIMLSPRNLGELWIIDRSASTEEAATQDGAAALLYRWGNPRVYRHGTADDQRLFRQHHTQWIAPGLPGAGNILVFNNGDDIGRATPPYYSSIEEIVPPVHGYGYRREPGKPYPPAKPVWVYTAENPTDFYSRILGCAQRLPNGNTLICEGTSGNLFQVTPDGKTVWQYVYPMHGGTPLKQGERPSIWQGDIFNNAVYRAYWYAPDHPGLQKYDLTPGDTIELYE